MSTLGQGHHHSAAAPEQAADAGVGGEEEAWKTVLRYLGPLFFMAMQVSALATAARIYQSRAVGSLSVFPFLSMWTNSFLWSLYGYLVGDYTVLVPNFTGALTGLVTSVVFHVHADEEQYERENKRYYVLAGSISLFGLVSAAYGNSSIIGTAGVVMCVVLMGSPLIVLRTVLLEKSCAAMPFWTSLTIWLNTLAWSLYGIFDAKDFNIYFPNLCGLFLGSVQMSMYLWFGLPPGTCSLQPGSAAMLLPTSASGMPRERSLSSVAVAVMGGPTGPIIPVRAVYTPLKNGAPKPAYTPPNGGPSQQSTPTK